MVNPPCRRDEMTSTGSWLRAQRRRLEQGILEQIGVVSSSRDETYELDNIRFNKLEEGIHRLNGCILQHMAADRKAAEDRIALSVALESLGSSDLTGKILPHSLATSAYLDSLTAIRRTTERLFRIVELPETSLLVSRVVDPLGRLVKNLPVLRRLIDSRREACADYDSYVRKLKAEQARGDVAEMARSEAKVAAAASTLHEAGIAVSTALTAAEQMRVILVRDAAEVVTAVRVHLCSHSAEAFEPLLRQLPGSAACCVDLAEGSINAKTVTTAKLSSPASNRASSPPAIPSSSPPLGRRMGGVVDRRSWLSVVLFAICLSSFLVFGSLFSALHSPLAAGLPPELHYADGSSPDNAAFKRLVVASFEVR